LKKLLCFLLVILSLVLLPSFARALTQTRIILIAGAAGESPNSLPQAITAPIAIASEMPLAASLSPFAGYPLLERISACESTGNPNGIPRQFLADGSILWGNDPKTGQPIKRDEGILQINTWVWGPLALKMGDDLATEDGNVAFGKYLYETYGTGPWTASEGCWGSSL
jgi:hypothetical protein